MTETGRSRTTYSAVEPSDPQTGDVWIDARGWKWTYDAEKLGGGWTLERAPSERGGRSQTVQVVLTTSREDAQMFVDDWRKDPTAPVLTGGWQEHPVTALAVEVSDDAGRAPSGALEDWLVRYTDWTPDDDWRDYNPPKEFLRADGGTGT